jgi:hypothetical protein
MVKRLELKYDWSQRIREHNERLRLMARWLTHIQCFINFDTIKA